MNLTFTEGAFMFLVPVALFVAPEAMVVGDFAGFVTDFAFSAVFSAVFSAIISTALAKIMFASSGIILAEAALTRINQVTETPSLKTPTHPQTQKNSKMEFKDVSFTYDSSEVPVSLIC